MAQTEPVETEIIIDDKKARAKFDDFERRIKKVEASGKRAGGGIGGMASAAIGGAAGFVAGAIQNNAAVNSVTDLLLNVIAGALLPLFVALLPVLQGLSKFLDSAPIRTLIEGVGATAGAAGNLLEQGGNALDVVSGEATVGQREGLRDYLTPSDPLRRPASSTQAVEDLTAINPLIGWLTRLFEVGGVGKFDQNVNTGSLWGPEIVAG